MIAALFFSVKKILQFSQRIGCLISGELCLDALNHLVDDLIGQIHSQNVLHGHVKEVKYRFHTRYSAFSALHTRNLNAVVPVIPGLGAPQLKILPLPVGKQFLVASQLHQLSLVKHCDLLTEPAG